MKSSIKVLSLVDRLATELDEYVQLHESLIHAYSQLLEENERLKDTIAIMADDNYQRGHRDEPEAN